MYPPFYRLRNGLWARVDTPCLARRSVTTSTYLPQHIYSQDKLENTIYEWNELIPVEISDIQTPHRVTKDRNDESRSRSTSTARALPLHRVSLKAKQKKPSTGRNPLHPRSSLNSCFYGLEQKKRALESCWGGPGDREAGGVVWVRIRM